MSPLASYVSSEGAEAGKGALTSSNPRRSHQCQSSPASWWLRHCSWHAWGWWSLCCHSAPDTLFEYNCTIGLFIFLLLLNVSANVLSNILLSRNTNPFVVDNITQMSIQDSWGPLFLLNPEEYLRCREKTLSFLFQWDLWLFQSTNNEPSFTHSNFSPTSTDR